MQQHALLFVSFPPAARAFGVHSTAQWDVSLGIALEAKQVLIARMQRGAGNEIQGTIPGASSHVLC
jgi:hypothetical protein